MIFCQRYKNSLFIIISDDTFSETAVLIINKYFNLKYTYLDSEVFKRSNKKLFFNSKLKEKKEKNKKKREKKREKREKKEKKEKKENVKMFSDS